MPLPMNHVSGTDGALGWVRETTAVPRLIGDYVAAGWGVLTKHPAAAKPSDLVLSFFPWLCSMSSAGALADQRPWITFAAARFVEKVLSPQSRVFEFGAGGSTLYFARRVAELVTVEHDPAWLDRTKLEMSRLDPRLKWHAHLAQAQSMTAGATLPPTHPDAYASTDPALAGKSFKEYASVIDRYPDNYFDLVLIDGRARPSCFKHVLTKVKIGGYIVLDNAERAAYAYVEDLAARLGFAKTEFWGPGPYNRYFWRTLFLQKVRRGFGLKELDVKLNEYLDLDNGTFVEAGANDGFTQSNTLYFEMYRGWRGLLVEPIPELAEQCRLYRPRATVEQAALVSADNKSEAITVRYANLMSVVKGGMKGEAEENAHIEAGMRVQNVGTYEVDVPTITLSALLDKHGVGAVDLLSLDVEGYELNALRGLDLTRHRPRYILVEARYRDEVHAYLSPWYDLVTELSHHDLLYRLKATHARS